MLYNRMLSQTDDCSRVALLGQQFEVWLNAHWDEVSGRITFLPLPGIPVVFFRVLFLHSINLIARARASAL